MKIYFDGCSMTSGGIFLGENWKTDRWSKILCDRLGAEEYNYAHGGGSNQRILRQLTTIHNIDDYDLAIIQMTYPERIMMVQSFNRCHHKRQCIPKKLVIKIGFGMHIIKIFTMILSVIVWRKWFMNV